MLVSWHTNRSPVRHMKQLYSKLVKPFILTVFTFLPVFHPCERLIRQCGNDCSTFSCGTSCVTQKSKGPLHTQWEFWPVRCCMLVLLWKLFLAGMGSYWNGCSASAPKKKNKGQNMTLWIWLRLSGMIGSRPADFPFCFSWIWDQMAALPSLALMLKEFWLE